MRVAIVGSGPGGFYTAQHLLKKQIKVTMIEKLPAPFGLVRYGVSPMHPDVKNVIHKFEKLETNPDFKFIGNVQVGVDASVQDLKQSYHAVVLAYGSNKDRKLNIPGEQLRNVFSSKSFVGWYNGHPDNFNLDPDLSLESAVIIGQGNVALDIARILLSPIDDLKKTDITEHAIQKLAESKIKRLHIVGRRGPVQAAFTAKELRELLAVPRIQFLNDKDLLKREIARESDYLASNRQKKRLMDILVKAESLSEPSISRKWSLDYLASPKEFFAAENGKVCSILFEKNSLLGNMPKVEILPSNETFRIPCGLVINSIGYENQPLAGIPFDFRKSSIPNVRGKVDDGLYVSGWLKNGPKGVIASTMYDAIETAESIIEDLDQLSQRPVEPEIQFKNATSFADWSILDKYEVEQGKLIGKPREKVSSVENMLGIIRNSGKSNISK